jgi:glycosyltransferase involved in cell wall biosynthesis
MIKRMDDKIHLGNTTIKMRSRLYLGRACTKEKFWSRNSSSSRKGILFISTWEGSADWGGSEELWSQTALRLSAEGYSVSVSVFETVKQHPRILNLLDRGIQVRFRPARDALRKRVWRKITGQPANLNVVELQRSATAHPPSLVVFSDGGSFSPLDLLEICTSLGIPFVTIAQANVDWHWPIDELAARYRTAFSAALRCYFVSEGNLRLAEKQIGSELLNAEIVRNPFNVDFNSSPPWPEFGKNGALRFACVARLDPPAKGQDLLLEALAGPSWASRRWALHLYGEGKWRFGLERMVQRLGLSDRVVFEGRVSVEQIWASNHALIMPSRYEGLPLALIEAMLCGRPVIATDVAGHAEVIKDGVTGFLAEAPTVNSIAEALERFWARRAEAKEIGAAASRSIRQLIPPDPVGVFADQLKDCLVQVEARQFPRGYSEARF